jgi:riboflavin biosynthesis pyrimidine reductase
MLWPSPQADVDPTAVYAADHRPGTETRPWLLANMIASADGSATDPSGRSGGLGGAADKAVFAAIRGVADVIVAGSATVISEDYGPSRPSPAVVQQRLDRGQTARPRIAVVSGSLTIDPERRLFRDAPPDARPIVLTHRRADAQRRRNLESVAEVLTVGDEHVDWPLAIEALGATVGARVVLCEGGPTTVALLVEHDLLDELCLTIAPTLLAGDGSRIVQGPASPAPRYLALDHLLTEDDFLFLRYVRDRTKS